MMKIGEARHFDGPFIYTGAWNPSTNGQIDWWFGCDAQEGEWGSQIVPWGIREIPGKGTWQEIRNWNIEGQIVNQVRKMGFGSFMGGIVLMFIAVLAAIFGIAILLGVFTTSVGNNETILGIVSLVIAFLLFAFGWYSYKSAEPRGTYNVRNVGGKKWPFPVIGITARTPVTAMRLATCIVRIYRLSEQYYCPAKAEPAFARVNNACKTLFQPEPAITPKRFELNQTIIVWIVRLVGSAGFEPAIFCVWGKRHNR
jgi:hypothetical protein